MPLYRIRHVDIAASGDEVVSWRYTDRKRRMPAEAAAPARVSAPSQPEPAPVPTQAHSRDIEREILMADLARQIGDFGNRLGALERSSTDTTDDLARKFGDVQHRLTQIGSSIAEIEAHDQRQSDRVAQIEKRVAQHGRQIHDIEQSLGVIAEEAARVANARQSP